MSKTYRKNISSLDRKDKWQKGLSKIAHKKNVEFCDEKFFTNEEKCIIIISAIDIEFKN